MRRTRSRAFLGLLLVVAAAAALPYVIINDEPDHLTAEARARAAGHFAHLSRGQTHYQVTGPDEAHTVVLVHGTTMPSFVWDRNVDALVRAGRRVARYDLYGRGFSDRPDARYDLDLYVRQLEDLLAHITSAAPVDLVGFSMGGLVVSDFARRHPHRVRKMVLIAPAGIGTQLPPVAKAAMAPGVGEYIMRVSGTRQLLPSRRNFLYPERHPGFDAAYLDTIRFEGSRRAVLRSLRHMPFSGYEAGYEALGRLEKPILLVWGRHDLVVPFSASERVRELLRPAAFVPVDDAGHLVHYERPGFVNAALIDFLGR